MTDDFGEKEAFLGPRHRVDCNWHKPRQEILNFARAWHDEEANGCLDKRRDVWIFAHFLGPGSRLQSTH